MIICSSVDTKSMAHEESEIYIARKRDGTLITVTEYAAREAGLSKPTPIFCPHCFEEDDEERLLIYDAEKRRFLHQGVSRNCYRDDRTEGRAHSLIQQTAFKQLKNDDCYSHSDMEYPVERWTNTTKLSFDVGAILPRDDDLRGILVEVQHQSGSFSRRLFSRVKLAQKRNYGVHIVFSPSARYQKWFGGRLIKMKGYGAQFGSYDSCKVDLGTMIRPEDDRNVLRTKSRRKVRPVS